MTPRGTSRGSTASKGGSSEKAHKLIKINPLVVDEQDLMFGNLNQNNDWVDGIFTNACRKANRVSILGLLQNYLNGGQGQRRC